MRETRPLMELLLKNYICRMPFLFPLPNVAQNALRELEFTMDQFIDFCILCGCDYCDRLKGK